MAVSLYCGGRFHFDYLEEGFERYAAEDYRAEILGDVHRLLKGPEPVILSDSHVYVGPFYFESDGMVDGDIVETEMRQVERCTDAVFLLEDGLCPGTIAEMVYAATLRKRLRIYYLRDELETESALCSPCWYPIIVCQKLNGQATEVIACPDISTARERIKEWVSAI